MLKIMRNKQIREILNQIKEQFDAGIKGEYLFLINSKDKVYITNPEYLTLVKDKIKSPNIGLYFGTIEKHGFRLSIEGTELLDNPKKNIIELTESQFYKYMSGLDLEIEDTPGYKLIKYKNRFIGCAKLSKNILRNYIPKPRRAKEKI